MREIRFRAWDKVDNKIRSVTGLSSLNFNAARSYVYLLPAIKRNISNTVLMQYTGLKDKNDKEIYEGDIVKWGHHCDRCSENPVRIAEVEMFPALQFNFKSKNYIFEYGHFAYAAQKDSDTLIHIEVIGNIHENSELLK